MVKIEKLDKIEQKLKIGQYWKLKKIENWTKMKIGQNWKVGQFLTIWKVGQILDKIDKKWIKKKNKLDV